MRQANGSIESKQVDLTDDQAAPVGYLVPAELFNCAVAYATVDKPQISPQGHTYSDVEIRDHLKLKHTDPKTQRALTADELRKNNLIAKMLKGAVTTVELNVRKVMIDRKHLLYPGTDCYYENPVVDKNGDTQEGNKGARYFNFMLQSVIDEAIKQDLASGCVVKVGRKGKVIKPVIKQTEAKQDNVNAEVQKEEKHPAPVNAQGQAEVEGANQQAVAVQAPLTAEERQKAQMRDRAARLKQKENKSENNNGANGIEEKRLEVQQVEGAEGDALNEYGQQIEGYAEANAQAAVVDQEQHQPHPEDEEKVPDIRYIQGEEGEALIDNAAVVQLNLGPVNQGRIQVDNAYQLPPAMVVHRPQDIYENLRQQALANRDRLGQREGFGEAAVNIPHYGAVQQNAEDDEKLPRNDYDYQRLGDGGGRSKQVGEIACVVGVAAGVLTGYFIWKAAHKHDNNGGGSFVPPIVGCVEPSVPLTYDVMVPWQGGGKICLNNNQPYAQSIGQWQFTNNVNVTSQANIWGDLIPWGSNLKVTPAPYFGFTYLITPPTNNPISIPANSQLCLTYNYDQMSGPWQGVPTIPPSGFGVWANGGTIPLAGVSVCTANPVSNYTMGAFTTSWGYYRQPDLISSQLLTKVNELYYAFAGMLGTGDLYSLDPNADGPQVTALAKLGQQYSFLRNYIALGGYNSYNVFEQITNDNTALTNFGSNLLELLKLYQFKGVMLDAEGMDPTLFVKLHKSVGSLMQQNGYLFSSAMPAGADEVAALKKAGVCQLAPLMTSLKIMAYDDFGPWNKFAYYAAPFANDPNSPSAGNPITSQYNFVGTANAYANLTCFSNQQLHMGVPMYAWTTYVDQFGTTNGLDQTVIGTPPGQYNDSTGQYTYRCVQTGDCQNGIIPLPTDTVLIPTAQNPNGNYTIEPWGYGTASGGHLMTITYEDLGSAARKTAYIVDQKLGGSFVWEISQDAPINSSYSLTAAISDRLAANNGNFTLEQLQPLQLKLQQGGTDTTSLVEYKESDAAVKLRAELYSTIEAAAKQGLLFSFILTLSDKNLSGYLTACGFSKTQVSMASEALRTVIMIAGMGVTPASFIAPAVNYLLLSLGFSRRTANVLSTTAAVAVNTAPNPFAIMSAVCATAAALASSTVGGKMADGFNFVSGKANVVAQQCYKKGTALARHGLFAVASSAKQLANKLPFQRRTAQAQVQVELPAPSIVVVSDLEIPKVSRVNIGPR